MPQEDQSQQLSELKNQFNTLRTELDSIKNDLEEHQHTGADGSFRITDADIVLKEKHAVLSGPGGMVGNSIKDSDQKQFHIVCGPEGIGSGVIGTESKNMQLTFDYSPTNCFLNGLANAIANEHASIIVSSTQTTLTDPSMDFGEDDSRAGYYLSVIKEQLDESDPIFMYGYLITANTKHAITISTAFGFSGKITGYAVYNPIYLGGNFFQFIKLRTLNGIGFGPGQVGNGQNSLLYIDSAGALKYRKFNGDISTIVAA